MSRYGGYGGYGWGRYVPVAERRAKAAKKIEKLRKGGLDVHPVSISGNKIARTFWGKAWCDHLESFSDYANRLPRGRTYVRNGSVCHLDLAEGKITAFVSGSELYHVEVGIKTLPPAKWKKIKQRCAGQIGSVLELLQGKLSKNVMAIVSDRTQGLFPRSGEISFGCSCPDWASMCKHVAAVLYGVGARLDEQPELLFLLRGVDHTELISSQIDLAVSSATGKSGGKRLADEALADVFGIEMADDTESRTASPPAGSASRSSPGTGQSIGKSTGKNTQSGGTRSKSGAITGLHVARLRKKLDLTRAELACLLGVSPATIGNWEKKTGALGLHDRTRTALSAARKLTKKEARRKLDEGT